MSADQELYGLLVPLLDERLLVRRGGDHHPVFFGDVLPSHRGGFGSGDSRKEPLDQLDLHLNPGRAFPERSPVLCQVRMVNELPLVPDLERLEEMIADETTVTVA